MTGWIVAVTILFDVLLLTSCHAERFLNDNKAGLARLFVVFGDIIWGTSENIHVGKNKLNLKLTSSLAKTVNKQMLFVISAFLGTFLSFPEQFCVIAIDSLLCFVLSFPQVSFFQVKINQTWEPWRGSVPYFRPSVGKSTKTVRKCYLSIAL